MLVARHARKWWNFCMSEDEKKKKQNQFLLSNAFNASLVYNIEVLERFGAKA